MSAILPSRPSLGMSSGSALPTSTTCPVTTPAAVIHIGNARMSIGSGSSTVKSRPYGDIDRTSKG